MLSTTARTMASDGDSSSRLDDRASPQRSGYVRVMPSKQVPSERRALTRERLIQAATHVVAEHGFHAATVDQIAQRAGFSIGALYSNFASKDDLLFAVFDGHLVWFEERLRAAAGDADPGGAVAEWMSALGQEPDQFLVFIEFWSYAVRKPKVRQQFEKRMAQMRAAVAAAVTSRARETGMTPPLAPELIALLALAIGRGLALEKLVDADAVPDEAIGQLLASMLG